MEYWVLSEENFEEVLSKIAEDGGYYIRPGAVEGLRHYFQRELEQAVVRSCALVVYKKDGVWKHLFISRQYNVDWVMQHSEDRL